MNRTVTLANPIPGKDGSPITELKFISLKVKDRKKLQSMFPADIENKDMTDDQSIPILAFLFDLPPASIEEIDLLEDFPKVMEAMQSFFPKSRETGTSASGQ